MKYLEETSLIITDLITETIVLFVALLIVLNYYISKDKDNNLCDTPHDTLPANGTTKTERKDTKDDDPWELLKSIIGENVDHVIYFLKNCMNLFISFSFYISLLYIFFYLIRPSKNISFPRHTFDRNIKFIFEDFGNKLAFILLFPILLITMFSLMFVSIKIMFEYPKKVNEVDLRFNIFLQIGMFFWFLLLFYVLGHILYLFTWGNVIRLINNPDLVGWYSVMYFFSFILMSIIFFAGFYKLLLFVLTTIFLLNPKDIKHKLYEKEMYPLYFIIQFALSFTLLMNIKQLFSFELWIFGIVIFILFFILLAKAYYDNYNK